jgi:FkbM family methyltransferase
MRNVLKRFARVCGADLRGMHNVGEVTFLNLPGKGIDQILDVGANDGGFARLAVRRFPGAHLHCFEPLGPPRLLLEEWIAREGAGRVRAWPCALSDVDGVAEIHEHLDHSASSSLLPITAHAAATFPQSRRQAAVAVQTRTLDHWVRDESIELSSRCLLKIDVQGLEFPVLKGGSDSLRTIYACILELNVAPLYQGQSIFSDMVSLLRNAGLNYIGNLTQIHDKHGQPLFLDAVFERTV